MKSSITMLRTVHGLFALYFIFCIFVIYYSAITLHVGTWLTIALLSLFIEGFLVFIINNGDCPLKYLQHKIGDQTPFFNLFLPKKLAKRAVPFFTILTVVGIILLTLRFILGA